MAWVSKNKAIATWANIKKMEEIRKQIHAAI